MKGKTNNPHGRPKGGINEKTRQWEELAESIKTRHSERFNAILDDLDDEKFSDKYLQVLEYFKPKLARTDVNVKGEITEIKVTRGSNS